MKRLIARAARAYGNSQRLLYSGLLQACSARKCKHFQSPFTVALAEYLARSPLPMPAHRALGERRLLVVDDDAETVELVATVLQSAGATVMTAQSAPDALARLGASWPDLLLADLSMPRHDGYSLLRQARALADASVRRLTAVAFTALGHDEEEKALRAGLRGSFRSPSSRMCSWTSWGVSQAEPRRRRS